MVHFSDWLGLTKGGGKAVSNYRTVDAVTGKLIKEPGRISVASYEKISQKQGMIFKPSSIIAIDPGGEFTAAIWLESIYRYMAFSAFNMKGESLVDKMAKRLKKSLMVNKYWGKLSELIDHLEYYKSLEPDEEWIAVLRALKSKNHFVKAALADLESKDEVKFDKSLIRALKKESSSRKN